jgi:hypothetical protein
MAVTATDTILADVGIRGEKISAIAEELPVENATRQKRKPAPLDFKGAAPDSTVAL